MIDTEVPSYVSVGDYVEITTENEVMLKHILALYGIPLVIMLGTIFILNAILKMPNKDIISAFAGLASLAVSFFILKAYDKKKWVKCSKIYSWQKIIKKVNNEFIWFAIWKYN